jgi:hypothetical protein
MKLSKSTFLTSLTVALAALSINAFAGEGEPKEPEQPAATIETPAFEELDANLDGVITPMEAEDSWLAEAFADIDLNQDGLINRSEYESGIS